MTCRFKVDLADLEPALVERLRKLEKVAWDKLCESLLFGCNPDDDLPAMTCKALARASDIVGAGYKCQLKLSWGEGDFEVRGRTIELDHLGKVHLPEDMIAPGQIRTVTLDGRALRFKTTGRAAEHPSYSRKTLTK